jgi:type VI protein secretion system component Hcp
MSSGNDKSKYVFTPDYDKATTALYAELKYNEHIYKSNALTFINANANTLTL